uniref:DCN1-like protein n=1 Tax=Microcebus murinus TaxID=30608 RepID=A0A8C5W678_MICMU
MGHCVTKFTKQVGAGHCEEQVPPCGKPGEDILLNGTKKADTATEACQLPTSSRIAGRESKCNAEKSSLRCKDELEDTILEEGTERFCNDLCIDPAGFRVLLLAWKFEAATMCKFTRKEFFDGCKAVSAYSLDGICARFPSLLTEAKQEDTFKGLYWFAFQFGLDSEEGQGSLHQEIAIALWKLNNSLVLDQWLNFLMENLSGIQRITRDTWNMFLNFTQVIARILSNYSEDEAWPSFFYTFVDWIMERRKREGGRRGTLSSGPEVVCAEELT